MNEPQRQGESTQVIHGDCIEVMKGLESNSIDSIITDPPYGLGFMGKEWDQLPPGKEWAEECLRVLKPGGHILAFGGSRTWHRLAVSVEDAGFEIRDSIMWVFGSGFPKHRANLKPAFEPIVMGRKPFKGSLVANEAEYSTGALNINDCRIGSEGGRWPANVILDETQAESLDIQSGITTSKAANRGVDGGIFRLHGFSSPDELRDAAESGEKCPDGRDAGATYRRYLASAGNNNTRGHDDSGGASRFFYVAKAPKRERPVVDGVAHPTVKPLTLMRHLVRLVTPEGGTVLDPFAGSGTTLEAATLEGFPSIGIEREAEYLPLIQARLDRSAA